MEKTQKQEGEAVDNGGASEDQNWICRKPGEVRQWEILGLSDSKPSLGILNLNMPSVPGLVKDGRDRKERSYLFFIPVLPPTALGSHTISMV